MSRIRKLLVANRGEIAARIFRTAHEMGISTVAVYSDPDEAMPFVNLADESVSLPGNTPAETYLRADLIIEAAKSTGADAVHPGYGFLSENEDFARACADAGITFVGPSPESIAAMGSKIEAKRIMEGAGVPILPGTVVGSDEDSSPERLLSAAEEIGLPVLVKAAFGGGGRGMRIVHALDELVEAVRSARREAESAFGNGTVFLEKFIESPRHIEVQIFGDTHGNVVHLGERECSIQRRYQKIVEESPSTAVSPELRDELGRAAIAAGRAIDYVGAGTVEFVMAQDGAFYFLEVNTRLQVEHPVTELVTGTDLVRAQLLVASGEPLPYEVLRPSFVGHAIEVRLYAEDAAAGFVPVSGLLHSFEIPEGPGVRVDTGFSSGSTVSTFYDPMLAKVIAFGRDRDEAADRLIRTLRRSTLFGVTTNRDLLVGILDTADFRAGLTDTAFLDRHPVVELEAGDAGADPTTAHACAAALAAVARNRENARILPSLRAGFRNVRSGRQELRYLDNERQICVQYAVTRSGVVMSLDGKDVTVRAFDTTAEGIDAVIDGVRRKFRIIDAGESVHVSSSLGNSTFGRVDPFPDPSASAEAGSLLAPMPGTVVRVEVSEGDEVSEGQTVIVLEAMKMEHSIKSPAAGTVSRLPVALGAQVDTGETLVVISGGDQE